MRLAGAVLTFLAATAFGFYMSYALSLRVCKLSQVCRYIDSVTEQMRTGRELPQILASVKSRVFIKDGVWHGTEGLKDEDKNVLNSFLSALGTTDLEGQQKNALSHRAELSALLDAARRKKAECSRLYVSLGFCGGLFFAILVI